MTETGEYITELLAPPLAANNFVLEDVTVRQTGVHRSVEVIIDRDDDSAEAVSLNDIARATDIVSEVLDPLDLFDNNQYQLEVSSPGATRPLSQVRHFKRNVGRTIDIETAEEKFQGELLEVHEDSDEASISIALLKYRGKALVKSGEERRLALAEVRRAKVVLQFK